MSKGMNMGKPSGTTPKANKQTNPSKTVSRGGLGRLSSTKSAHPAMPNTMSSFKGMGSFEKQVHGKKK